MRSAIGSVLEGESRGFECAALTFFRGANPDCGCEKCLLACDSDAAAGRFPTNASWWLNQTYYPVTMPVGETGARY